MVAFKQPNRLLSLKRPGHAMARVRATRRGIRAGKQADARA